MKNTIYRVVFGCVISFGMMLSGCTSSQIAENKSAEVATDEMQAEKCHYTLVAAEPAEGQDFKAAADVLDKRLKEMGYEDYWISTGNEGITLEIAEEDIEKLSVLFVKGELNFREGTSADGAVILSGEDIALAAVIYNDVEREYSVALDFTDSGADMFAKATERLVGEVVSIWLDSECISSPTVQSKITGGKAVITNPDKDYDSAFTLACQINSGTLPFELEIL